MNVLSLFDGMSCGQIALGRSGIKVDNYYASELDKYAITVTQANYPGTIQLGDVIKWREWNIDWASIDLLIGGSPCQGFSFAGKQLAFDDPRSKLFFVYRDILQRINDARFYFGKRPVKYMLENVRMKKQYLNVISDKLGLEPVHINSALVSAQNRQRYYWANWKFEQPEDKGIFLKDIIYQRPHGFNSGGLKFKKSPSITTSAWEQNNFVFQFPHGCSKGGVRNLEKVPSMTQQFQNNFFKLIHSEKALEYMDRKVKGGRSHWDFKHHSDVRNDKSAAIVANFFKGVPYNVLKDWGCIRKFSPVECERLQTVPDNYTNHVSNTQRYKMLGNGWTIDVIAHVFKWLKKDNDYV